MWLLLALFTALFESGKDVFGKQGLRAGADPYVMAWAWRLLALPFLLPLLPFALPATLGPHFWPALLAGAALNILAAVLYMKAIAEGELSLSVPLISFTPLFLLLTSPLLLREIPGKSGILGVLLIVAGAYLLNIGHWRRGWREPIRALLRARSARLMLAVALIWSVSANIDKIGLLNSSPLLWAIAINAAIALGMLPLVMLRRRLGGPAAARPWGFLLLVGLCGGLVTLCQMAAISLAQVPYVIAVKRLSVLFTALAGLLLLGERGLRERLAGTLVMLAGVLVLALA
ncbi:EamA family transporter [Geoalkalibacter sp.]|uniref:EamA family transporter n=1 Tax=Geoalkalibacter sp. TaxID=3041440 RepID=UPI00272DD303|nr:EamA family transporter [Geoalkalibacter sp.]